ncbi:LamG domain-containing protein, partial [Candidatus Pacearchaeota archaeon]|nr:LamG domain-containing protein [Candidatus Pacearchaeota archaeon]
MVHKKYIKRGNSKFGPYLYENYRDNNGITRTRYLGKGKEEKKNILRVNFGFSFKFILLFFFILVFSLLIFISYFFFSGLTGKAISSDMAPSQYEEITSSYISKNTSLEIKEPIKSGGKGVTKNKNKRMEFITPSGGSVRLYFDLLNYSEFLDDVAEIIVLENYTNTTVIKNIVISNETIVIVNETISNETIVIVNETISNETISNETIVIVNQTQMVTNVTNNESGVSNFTGNESGDIDVLINDTIEGDLVDDEVEIEEPVDEVENVGDEEVEIEESEDEIEEEVEEVEESEIEEVEDEVVEESVSDSGITGGVIRFFGLIGRVILGNQSNFNESVGIINTNINISEESMNVSFDNIKERVEILNEGEIEEIILNSTVEAEDFDIIVNKTPEDSGESKKYKWGYKVRLNDKKFFSRIEVTSNESINIYDENTLKIGSRNLMSFKDLVDSGFSVRFEDPSLEIIEEVIEVKIDKTIIENIISKVSNKNETNESNEEDNSENVNESLDDYEYFDEIVITNESRSFITGNVVDFFGFIGRVVGIDNSKVEIEDVKYENTIVVYIERDFNGTDYEIGDIIDLDPEFIIIPITDAEHLDFNRSYISNIYEEVKEQDDEWCEVINESEYIRASFESPLDNTKDITVYSRIVDWNNESNMSSDIIIYYEDNDTEIARIENITGEGLYKTYLTNLNDNESYFTFDLKVVGGDLEFDWVVDPIYAVENFSTSESIDINVTQENNFTHLDISDVAPYDSLMLYYPFDSNQSNTTVYDYSGNNHNGTINDDTIYNSSGAYGGGYDFDGEGDYIQTVFNSSSVGTNNTVIIWIKFNSCNEFNIMYGASVNYLYAYVNESCDGLRIYGKSDSQTDYFSTGMTIGSWAQIAVVENGVNVTAYINGVEKGSGTEGTSGTDDFVTIGGLGAVNEINGSIDEVMIFNTSLTLAQIQDIYNNQSARFKTPGKQELRQFNITAGNNTVNVTTRDFQEYLGSDLKLRLGEWDITRGYNDSVDGTQNPSDGDGLVGYWHFDNQSDDGENATHVFDYSGNGNNGTYTKNGTGGINDSGYYDKAGFFDGDGDYVNVGGGSGSVLDIAGDMAISVWIKLDSDYTSTQSMVGDTTWGGSTDRFHFEFGRTNNEFSFHQNNVIVSVSSVSLSDDNWHNVVVVRNGTSGDWDISWYLDGVFDETDNTATNPSATEANTSIGRGGDLDSLYFQGSIDEVMIYNRSLSQEEITLLYVKGKAKFIYSKPKDLGDNVTYAINTLTTNILPEYQFTAGNSTNPFYSPLLFAGMDFEYDLITDFGPDINFTEPLTLPNGTTTSNTTIEINVSITESDLDEVKFNWNGTNYTVFNDSVVLMMNFDNVSALGENDTHVVDLSGKGNNGTVTVSGSGGINITGGKYLGGFEADNNDHIDILYNDSLNSSSNQITIMVWAKSNGFAGTDTIFEKGKSGTLEYWFGPTGNKILFCFNPGDESDSDNIYVYSDDSTLTDSDWHHLAATFNSTYVSMYIDGLYASTPVEHDVVLYSGNGNMKIGEDITWGGSYPFSGTIDDMIIINISLSPEEIQQYYFSNLHKYDIDKWVLYVNQSWNSTTGLNDGNYSYFAS